MMCAPVFTEQEFTTLSSMDAYIRAARDGFAGVTQLFAKNIQVIACEFNRYMPVALGT